MPGGDRTGPLGQGSMTGRGLGVCAGFGRRGTGFGFRRGRGRGGFGWGVAAGRGAWALDSQGEASALREEARLMKRELADVERRLQEIENDKGS